MKYFLQKLLLLPWLAALLLTASCQNEDLQMNYETNDEAVSRYINLDELKAMPGAMEKYNEIVNPRRAKSTVYDIERGFHVYTDSILVMEYGDQQSITFLVMRDTVNSVVENIVLSRETCGYYKAYKTEYRLAPGDKDKILAGQSVNLDNKVDFQWFRDFESESIMKSGGNEIIMLGNKCYIVTYRRVQSISTIDGVPREYSVWVPTYTEVMCPEEPGDYSFTEDDHNGSSSGTFGPDYHPVTEGPITWNPGTGSGGNPNQFEDYSPFKPVNTKPVFLETFIKNDCDKIADAMANAALKQKILELATKVNDQVNEHGITMDKNGTIVDVTPGPFISPNLNPSEKYTAFSHIHNDHPDGTYSVFSYVDLRTISTILHNNKIDTGKFIATLSTFKGTHYVLVISNVSNFKNFFYYWNNQGGTGNMSLVLESLNKARPLQEKYYDNKSSPKISQTNTDNEQVLSEFLNFLKEAGMGVTLYEANPTFTNFKKLSKDSNNNIVKEDCD